MQKAMNTKLLLIPFIFAGLSSCSTAYKTVQTPDDVYFSPAPPHAEYVSTENNDNRTVYNDETIEDREIRTTIHNRRWRRLHRYDYDYGYNYPYGYYPYGMPVYIDPKTGKAPVVTQPRKYNLGTYKNPVTPSTSVLGTKTAGQSSSAPVRTFPAKPANNGSAVGNLIRKVFSGSNESSVSDDNSSRTRSFDSKSSSSSNNSSSASNKSSNSSNNAPVRTFPKK